MPKRTDGRAGETGDEGICSVYQRKRVGMTANMLFCIAVIVWVAGIICAVFAAMRSLVLTMAVLAGFGVAGLVCMCRAELFQRIEDMAAILESMQKARMPYRDD